MKTRLAKEFELQMEKPRFTHQTTECESEINSTVHLYKV